MRAGKGSREQLNKGWRRFRAGIVEGAAVDKIAGASTMEGAEVSVVEGACGVVRIQIQPI